MKKNLLIAALSLAVLLSFAFDRAPAPAMRMGQPIFDRDRSAFMSELFFGQDGFAVVYFRTPELAAEFARLSSVEIVMRAAPVRIARSEIVVEAQE